MIKLSKCAFIYVYRIILIVSILIYMHIHKYKNENKYNYDTMKFPTSYNDIKTLEENNKVCVIVYTTYTETI